MKRLSLITNRKGTLMLNTISNTSQARARLSFRPIRSLVKLNEKHRQRQSLKKLDAHALADMGISIVRRNEELRNLRSW